MVALHIPQHRFRRWMPLFLLATPQIAAAEDDRISTWTGTAIAVTLIGVVFFQMCIFYLVNHYDPDMRRYTYDIINHTLSVFSAVLLFQAFDDQVEYWLMEHASPEKQAIIDMLHMLLWFVLLQLILAWMSGALKSAVGGRLSSKRDLKSSKLELQYASLLLAHLTAFAAINAWGALQQLHLVKLSAARCLAILPVAILGQSLLVAIMFRVRSFIERVSDYGVRFRPISKLWEELSEEAENDVMSLVVSFNATQVLRYVITGSLPSQEGIEDWSVVLARTADESTHQSLQLMGVGQLCVFAVLLLYLTAVEPPDKPLDFRPRILSDHVKAFVNTSQSIVSEGLRKMLSGKTFLHHSMVLGDVESDSDEDEEEEAVLDLKQRVLDVTILVFSMGFAWCVFFSVKMFLQSRLLSDSMLINTAVALAISFPSFFSIRILDMLVDADWTDERADNGIKQIIKAIGILVGFGWERCFDTAVACISAKMPIWAPRHTCKFFLALACVAIVVPAWKRYLLPMTLEKGWMFGFQVERLSDAEWDGLAKIFQKKQANCQCRASNGDLSGGLPNGKLLEDAEHLGTSSQNHFTFGDAVKILMKKNSNASASPEHERTASRSDHQDCVLDSVHEGYSPLAGDGERHLEREVAELRRRNRQLEDVLMHTLDALKAKDRDDRAHADHLRSWTQQANVVVN